MFIATLVAAQGLTEQSYSGLLAGAGCRIIGTDEVETGRVLAVRFSGERRAARKALEQMEADVFVRAADPPAPELLIADMDSTMITVECIDELADYAGVKRQVAEVTEQAMQGELDFEAALRARVRLLAGLNVEVLRRCYEERVKITPGATTLVRTMKARGCRTILVSGGFSAFADRVAEAIGFDEAYSNRLSVSGGRLDGTVVEPILGAAAKRQVLIEQASDPACAVAIGDGANDIPMIEAAGFGIAFHGKRAVVAAADAAVRFGDLTTVLHGMGIPRAEWVQ